MVAIVAVLFRLFLLLELVKQVKGQADKGIRSAMEATAEIGMSVEGHSFWRRISSPEAIKRIASGSQGAAVQHTPAESAED